MKQVNLSSQKGSARLILFIVFVIAFALGVFYVYKSISNKTSISKTDCSLDKYRGKVSSELNPLITNLNIETYPIDAKIISLSQIAKSSDDNAYAILGDIAKCDGARDLQYPAMEALINKIKLEGHPISGEAFKLWFNTIRNQEINADILQYFSLLYEVFNSKNDQAKKDSILGDIFIINSDFAIAMTALLSFDEGEQRYADLIRVFVTQSNKGMDVKDKSILAIMLTNKSFVEINENELRKRIQNLNDADLFWVLRPLAKNSSVLLKDVLAEIDKRNLFNSFQKEILAPLATLQNRSDENQIKEALFGLALGTPDRQSISVIGRWYSNSAEKILFLAIPVIQDEELGLLAFEILAGRSLTNKIGAKLFPWVKTKLWDKRKNIFKAIATICVYEQATKDNLDKAFVALKPIAEDGKLFDLILETNEDKLIIAAIQSYQDIIYPDVMISLLSHKNKEIRMLAIKALKDYNEVIFLQEILSAYRKEKDEDVLKLYKQTHWVTENRGNEIAR